MDGRKKGILIATGVLVLVILLYVFGIFPPTYTLTMQVQGGGSVSPAVGEYSHRSGVEISLNATADTGYEFVGWSTTAGSIGNASRVENRFTMPSSDTTITARFRLFAYDVQFEDWDGSILQTVQVDHGTNVADPAAPERVGYDFTGWSPNLTPITEDSTFTAVYEIRSYTVTFLDGMGEEIEVQTVEHFQAPVFPDEPELEGHEFSGWSWSDDSVTEDLEIRAEFEPIEYEVTFRDWDGSVLDSSMVPYGSSAVVPEMTEREGYTFVGWDDDPSNIEGEQQFDALYEINVYDITFLDWDGTVITEDAVEHGSHAPVPADPERFDHRFLGWDRTLDAITADAVVTAQYEPLEHQVTFQEQTELADIQIMIFAEEDRESEVEQVVSDESGNVWLQLISGEYWYQAVAEGYEEWRGAFTVEAQPQTVLFALTPKKGSISGQVLDGESGEGVALTGLALYHDNGETVRTMAAAAAADRDGVFRLRELVPGDYTLRVSTIGYAEPEEQSITVGPGEDITDLEFVLDRIVQGIGSIELVDFGSDWLTFTVLDIEGLPYDGRVPWALELQERDGEALRDGVVGAEYEPRWDPNIDANGRATLRFEGLTTTAEPGTAQEITVETSNSEHSLTVVMELNVFGTVRER